MVTSIDRVSSALADGEWHRWAEVAKAANSLGDEMIMAAHLEDMLDEGTVEESRQGFRLVVDR